MVSNISHNSNEITAKYKSAKLFSRLFCFSARRSGIFFCIKMSSNRKLKILCLHGYRQNAELFKVKLGGFRKSIKNIADLTFVSAPLIAAIEETADTVYGNNIMREESECSKEGRSWWFTAENHTFSSKTVSEYAEGFQDTLNVINSAFKTMGPFDGILGFSQGASLVSLICGLKELSEFMFDFHFVILISGFPSLAKPHGYLYDKILTTKSLHIIGQNDAVIPIEMSKSLAAKFQSPEIVYHDGGHFVPTQNEVRQEYKTFLEKMRDEIICQSAAHSNVS